MLRLDNGIGTEEKPESVLLDVGALTVEEEYMMRLESWDGNDNADYNSTLLKDFI